MRDQELILSFNAEELATRGKSEFKVTASRTYYGSAVQLVKGELARCEEGVRDATLEPLGQAAELFSAAPLLDGASSRRLNDALAWEA